MDLDNPLFGADSDRNGIADKIIYEYDFADQDTDASDKNGHGSNIASIAASVASDANIIALKVFKDNGSGYFSDLEAALQWVNQNAQKYNIASVNLSLGDGQNWNTGNPRYGIGDELAAIASQNIIIAAAAGNSFYQFNSNPGLAYPAADSNTISVGAVWADNFGTNKSFSGGAIDYTTGADQIASFSQRSADQLDVFAPGIFITGANATGGTQSMGGTSQATPFISGLAVLAQQIAQEKLNRKLTLNEFRTLLDTTSVLINDGDDENDNVTNTGKNFPRVNALALAEGILKLNSQVSSTDSSNSNTNSTNDPLYLPSGSVKLTHTVTLTSGQTATDINFGNQLLNNAPTLGNAIADQNAKQGTAFNFQVPSNTFTDIDAGDVLTYSATLENGNALPTWLTFDATTRTFSGTPTNDNIGNLNVKVIATDKAGVTVSDIFVIAVENINNAPVLSNAITDQNAKQGTAFNFQIPSNTFIDIDAGDVLTYSATLENGNALPTWLTFNSTNRTFSGTPTNDNVGNLNIKLIATDKAGENVSDIFTITVENINDAPTLGNTIADQNAKQGDAFNFQIPSNTFTDIDAGDILTYSATLENSSALPNWLTFNPTTRIFSGTPTNDNVGNLNVKAIATDKAGQTVSDIFTITVENVNDVPVLKNPLLDQTVKVNSTFTFKLPQNTFSDPDAVNPYKNLVIFGDSLSDTGNAYKASGNTFPPSPNYQGRLSNGLIWVDYFAPDLQFTDQSVQNYAFFGANTGVSNTFGQLTVPGLLTQIQQFKTLNTNSIGKDGLYVIWAGANDFLNLATDPTQAVTNAVTNISSAIATLAELGAKEIVVGNLTDLGALPGSIANNNVANARAISIGFNAALNQALTNLEPALNVDLSLVDIFGLSTAVQANPANYKFTNITQPLITATNPVNPDQYAFWDDVHPTTRLHQLVTDTFETTLLNDGVIPDLIKYSATLADGSNLPDWLNFNSTTRTFSGTPNTGNVGKLDVKVIATDKAGATVNDIFTLAIENVNNAPTLTNAIADQNAKQGTAFNFQVPTNTFTDIDAGDVLTYSATLENGNALPTWLTFNSANQTFSGTPTNDNVGNLNVKVAATDKAGATVNDIFVIAIENIIDNQPTTVGTPGDDKLVATPGSQFNGQNNIVFTGAGKDEVELSTVSVFPNSGNNIVDLGSGDDTIFVNKGDRAFGSDGNDIFDARDGKGGNRMSGGAGDDTFFLGSNDRALGGDGNDKFYVVLGGGNLLSGGAGADQFWIVNGELPKAANTILDFQIGTDVLGISGQGAGFDFSDLTLNGNSIAIGTTTVTTLSGVSTSSLTAANFAFV
ncbi:MAG: putative Ig domain-containing protein [Aphanizomenon gracile PMC649.10]|nr:putative Ig domain-containing protein [Aphanizomenon gracile PMC649.10]